MKALLDFIAHHESRGDYNAIWGGIRKKDYPPKPLVEMTIREVLAWQDRIDPKYMSEASGRYQIMEDTLRGLYGEAGMSLDDKFDAAGQDALAVQLLKRRGLKRYLAGQISAEQFANNLAHEWASLPMVSGPKKGRSAYAGDGLNKALVDVEPFLQIVRSLRGDWLPKPGRTDVPAREETALDPPPSLWGAISRLIKAIFGGAK